MNQNTKHSTTLHDIQRQKAEVSRQLRQERQLMSIYTTALLEPFQKKQKGPTTPIKYLVGKMQTATYALKLAKGMISIFRFFH